MDSNKMHQIMVADKKLRISIGDKNLGKVKNKSATWGKLIEKMSQPQVDLNHTLEQYLKLSVERQGELKNVGFFVGGHCDNGVRRIGSVKERWVVTLDVDECGPGHLMDIEMENTALTPYEFFVYSTRKHTFAKPRIRIIIPLAKACEAEAYHALSRILGEKFDHTMESLDPVSYRVTQLMYWPSVCKDAEFYTYHNRGEMVEPLKVLEEFGDWQDHTKLPRSERDETQYNAAGKKPEDPELKDGLVGAFCRTYDVPAAIDEFLSDIYVDPIESHGGTRYTFAQGTTAHGAIVYDDGKFLYSNHMHDPASGHSQNAFDLVRIHLYGDLDKKAREGTTPMSMPSIKAMLEKLGDDVAVKRALQESNYDMATMFREDMDDEGVFSEVQDDEDDDKLSGPEAKHGNWLDHLDLNNEGVIKPTMNNVVKILKNDPRFKGCIQRNLFSQQHVYMNPLDLKGFDTLDLENDDPINGSLWTDTHTLYVKSMLESPRGKNRPGYGLYVTKENLNAAIDMAASQQRFHPVKSYLESVNWDGKKRAERVFIEYLGAEDNPYHREVCRLTLLAAVTRIFEPGHKFDYMPILEGLQGKGKSTFVSVLAHNWFREMGSFDDKNKSVEAMSGAWILEFAELHVFSKTEITRVKEFLSAKDETTRLAYAKNPRKFYRQCIFIGTTNQKEYLKDETGNRRFWPVLCTIFRINTDKLKRNLDQIWAEVVAMYRKAREDRPFGDLDLYLRDGDLLDFAVEMQKSRKAESQEEVLANQIIDWLEKPISAEEAKGQFVGEVSPFDEDLDEVFYRTKTCSVEIYEKVLGNERKRLSVDKSAQFLISKAMQQIPGWGRASKQGYFGSYGKQMVIYEKISEKINDDDDL